MDVDLKMDLTIPIMEIQQPITMKHTTPITTTMMDNQVVVVDQLQPQQRQQQHHHQQQKLEKENIVNINTVEMYLEIKTEILNELQLLMPNFSVANLTDVIAYEFPNVNDQKRIIEKLKLQRQKK